MKDVYESKISDARWIAYDLPGNVGWITYIVCLALLWSRGANAFLWIAAVPALLMLMGIAELISERVRKLDRVLPKARLLRGFGALTLGGVLGGAAALVGLIWFDGGVLIGLMLFGAALCALFAWLIFREYHRRDG